jgi:hypothetical protein
MHKMSFLGDDEDVADEEESSVEAEDEDGDTDEEDFEEDSEDTLDVASSAERKHRIDPDADDITHAIDCPLDETCACRDE